MSTLEKFYTVIPLRKFTKSIKKLKFSDRKLVSDVIYRLAHRQKLGPSYRNHKLKGNLKGCMDCHIHDDLVLLYKIDKDKLILSAIDVGTHEQLGL